MNHIHFCMLLILLLFLIKDTGIAVLGTMIEPLSKTKRSFVVNYSLLETNGKGEVCPLPTSGEMSTFEAIVNQKNKVDPCITMVPYKLSFYCDAYIFM